MHELHGRLRLVASCTGVRHLHLARAKPIQKHLSPRYLNEERLARLPQQITSLIQSAKYAFLPPLSSFYWGVDELEGNAPGSRYAPKAEIAIQILKANKGISKFYLQVHLFRGLEDDEETMLLTIGDLAAAAQRKDGTVEIKFGGLGYSDHRADLKLKAILELFPDKSAITSLSFRLLALHSLKHILEDEQVAPSLKVLEILHCNMSTNSILERLELPRLETLRYGGGLLPVGIIIGNAAHLRSLSIHARVEDSTAESSRACVQPLRADFVNLQELTISIQEVSPDNLAVRNMFLLNRSVTMPALRRLRTDALDCSIDDPSLIPILRRLPSLRYLKLEDLPLDREPASTVNIEHVDDSDSGCHALLRACEERQVKLLVHSKRPRCLDGADLADELAYIRALQKALRNYKVYLSVNSLKEPVAHVEHINLSELRGLSLTVGAAWNVKLQGEEVWADNLVGILRSVSAPLCEGLEIVFRVRVELLETARRLLEGIVGLRGFKRLVRISGECVVDLPGVDETGLPGDASSLNLVSEFEDRVSALQTQTGIDFSSFRVVRRIE